MTAKILRTLASVVVLISSLAGTAQATTFTVADITHASGGNVSGTLDGVSFAGTYTVWSGGPVPIINGTTNAFNVPGTFTPALAASDALTLFTQGTVTITFSSAIVDPWIDFLSFANDIKVTGSGITSMSLVSAGPQGSGGQAIAFNGTDTLIASACCGGLDDSGTLQLYGSVTSITLTPLAPTISDGALMIFGATHADAQSTVPEPASLLLLGSGLIGCGRSLRRRRVTVR